MNFIKSWTLFEKLWIVVASVAIAVVSILLGDGPLGFVSAICGILTVILAAKGKIATFVFGAVQSATYAYISYGYQLYGEAMLNALFFLPMQVVGWLLWRRHRATAQAVTSRGEDILARRLTAKQWLILTPVLLATIGGYALLLTELSARQVQLDSVIVVLSVVAQILMALRFAEQWLLWIVINVITITMWAITLVTTGGGDWAIFVMWCAFLVNSIYGYRNWLVLSRHLSQAAPLHAATEAQHS